MDMMVRVRPVGPWRMNACVLVCPAGRRSVLIDPGAEPDALMALLEGTAPAAILLTHSHADHIGALGAMRDALKVPVMAHPRFAGAAVDRPLADGEAIAVGGCRLRAFHTPGHTADQVAYAVEGGNVVVVGDALFEGGPGKTWSPEDFETTRGTLQRVVLAWPDDARCHPGHGPSFRLGDIRADIEAFLAKDHGRFCGDAAWRM